MKLIKIFITILITVFILAIIKSGYDLFVFDDNLAKDLNIVEISQKSKITNQILFLSIPIATAFACGLLSVMLVGFLSAKNRELKDKRTIKNIAENKGQNGDLSSNEFFKTKDLTTIQAIVSSNREDKTKLYEKILSSVCDELKASQGALYLYSRAEQKLMFAAGYAYYKPETKEEGYELGEGIIGQVAKDAKTLIINGVPEGYVKIISGLGAATPTSLMLVPIKNVINDNFGVIEIAGFTVFEDYQRNFVEKVAEVILAQLD